MIKLSHQKSFCGRFVFSCGQFRQTVGAVESCQQVGMVHTLHRTFCKVWSGQGLVHVRDDVGPILWKKIKKEKIFNFNTWQLVPPFEIWTCPAFRSQNIFGFKIDLCIEIDRNGCLNMDLGTFRSSFLWCSPLSLFLQTRIVY